MTNKKEYNGWSNYETWCVAFWLDNEEYVCNELMPEWCKEAYEDNNPKWYMKEKIKDYVEEMMEEQNLNDKGMFTDLINTALSECNYYEIGENYLENNPKETE